MTEYTYWERKEGKYALDRFRYVRESFGLNMDELNGPAHVKEEEEEEEGKERREGHTSSVIHIIIHIQPRLLGIKSQTGIRIVEIRHIRVSRRGINIIMRQHLQQKPNLELPHLLPVTPKAIQVRAIRQACTRRRGGRRAAREERRADRDVRLRRLKGHVFGRRGGVRETLVVGVPGPVVESEGELFGARHTEEGDGAVERVGCAGGHADALCGVCEERGDEGGRGGVFEEGGVGGAGWGVGGCGLGVCDYGEEGGVERLESGDDEGGVGAAVGDGVLARHDEVEI